MLNHRFSLPPRLLLIKTHKCFPESRCQIFLLIFRASFVLDSFSSGESGRGHCSCCLWGAWVGGSLKSLKNLSSAKMLRVPGVKRVPRAILLWLGLPQAPNIHTQRSSGSKSGDRSSAADLCPSCWEIKGINQAGWSLVPPKK